ncbi:nitrate- and nitrite sensing domain-containing protein [Microbispora bryophytorum]|uniref:sensor histidine kinase n=1 Tax=Microbispora bryophytorum TaxID=1460882 RepID=UPI0033E4835B
MWGFALKLTVGDGLVLLRSKTLYDTIGTTSTDLGTQIQAERALTAGVLSSGRTTSAALTAQQAKTTAAADTFKKSAEDEAAHDAMSDELTAPLESLLSSLERLPTIREGVSLGSADRLTTITAYNSIMDDLFALYERLVSVPDLATFQQASAMQAMGNAHEMITREDALVRGALASGTITAAEQNAFSEWVATRRFLYGKNRPVLSGEMRAPYEQVLTSPLFDRFTALENQIINQVRSGGPLPADAEKWSPTVDQLILRLDSARVKASDALSVSATSVATGVMLRILIAGGLGLVVIIVTIVFSVRFGRRLARDLAGLRDAALELAVVRLPQVVEKLRRGEEVDVEAEAPAIKATGSNEVEDVARAFTSVQRTAVEAAVGQAALRRGVSHVFLNLARRNQTLLHRQLTLLDTMQRRAEDPESLEDLFRLDHLTTRMRRHAESLIILSGSAPGRSWRKPVPLIDVVRAAISEVEDYTRVAMAPMPDAAIAGATVADVVHLIAELVENATIFSPPQTKVAVRGEIVANGLAVEIEDRGLGLMPEEYDEINARLSDPPEFDLADSDRLGLFVVGQLAARHEIRVILRGSPFGGTTAIVLIPRTLMTDKGSRAALAGPVPRGVHAKPTPAAGGNDTDISLSDTLQADLGLGGPAPAGDPRGVRTLAGQIAGDAQDDASGGHPVQLPGRVSVEVTGGISVEAPGGVPREASREVPGEVSGEAEDREERTGASEPSPFFTPAALRSEAAPSASPSAAFSASPSVAPSSAPATAAAGAAPNGLAQRTSKQRARGAVSNGTHAGLPRRVRQANIAPQLRTQSEETAPQTPPLSAPTVEERSPEEARAMFSAFQHGARRGREDSDQPGGAAPGDHVHNTHGEKGDE